MEETNSEVIQKLKYLCQEIVAFMHKLEEAHQEKGAKSMPASTPINLFTAVAIL